MAYVLSRKAQPLPQPSTAPDFIPHVSEENRNRVLAAYTLCYNAEQELLQQNQQNQQSYDLINIRILGYMFMYNTDGPMVLALVDAVNACNGAYAELGKFFMDYWIRPCTYTPSSIVS